MGMKKVYTCNICEEEKEPSELHGCKFINNQDFNLVRASEVDGAHICDLCLEQMADQSHVLAD